MKLYLLILALVSYQPLSLFAADAAAGQPTEDRLDKLEREMQALRQENRDLRRQLGLDGPATNTAAVVKAGSQSNEIRLGGFVQAQAEFGDPGDARWSANAGNDRFFLRRARLNVTGKFLEHFNYKLEGDFAGYLGESSGLRAQLTDGWANWNRYDFLNVKAGQFFPAYGWEKRLSPLALHVPEFSLAGDRLLPERQLGVQFNGNTLQNRLAYTLGLFNGNNLNNNFNDDDNFMVVPRLEGVPFQGRLFGQDARWALAASGYYSDDARLTGVAPDLGVANNIFAGLRRGLSFDTQFKAGPVEIWAEFLRTDFEPVGVDSFVAQGWYVQGGYYFLPKWQAVVKYDEFNPRDDQDGDVSRTWTFGINYRIRGDYLKLMLDYLLVDAPRDDDLQNKVILRMQAAF